MGLEPISNGLPVVRLIAVEHVVQFGLEEEGPARGAQDGRLVCVLEVNEYARVAALLSHVVEGAGEIRDGEERGLAQAVLQRRQGGKGRGKAGMMRQRGGSIRGVRGQ